ncbi:hypothetical protein [Enterocloster lavalensis]|uniref:hypothetical protein n=1 Tax=Enterocloster lavalensis TaxID=460384 RepID=UPI002FDB96D7
MYIIGYEPDDGMIRYYSGKEKGEVRFVSRVRATKYAVKYKTYTGAKKRMNELNTLPGGKKARLFIMPEEIYVAYEEWADRQAAKYRKEVGIE